MTVRRQNWKPVSKGPIESKKEPRTFCSPVRGCSKLNYIFLNFLNPDTVTDCYYIQTKLKEGDNKMGQVLHKLYIIFDTTQ